MTERRGRSFSSALRKFCDECGTDRLSLEFVQRSIAALPREISDDEFNDAIHRCPLLHRVCANKFVSLEIVQEVLRFCPGAIHLRDDSVGGLLPLHILCENRKLDDSTAMDVLKHLVQLDFATVREPDDESYLPIHWAAGEGRKNRAFCECLVNLFPESVRAQANCLNLPFHEACAKGCLDTVKYFYELYPEALGLRTQQGLLPIHLAVSNGCQRSEIFDFIRSQDPDCLSKTVIWRGSRCDGHLPLHLMVDMLHCPDAKIGAKDLFDAYPEAILTRTRFAGLSPLGLARAKASRDYERNYLPPDLLPFLEVQHEYALKSERVEELTTADGRGRLLLHRAILDKRGASLGAIKLLVNGNPNAVRAHDNDGRLPVQLACQHSTLDIVQYLLELDESDLGVCDNAGDNLLHLACRAGNSGTVKYLLDKCPSLVSSENGSGMLPLHLMCNKSGKGDDILESVEYAEAIWRLLLAEPSQLEQPIGEARGL